MKKRPPKPNAPAPQPRWIPSILAAGILLRVCVYSFLYPHYADDHFRVILWLEQSGTLPAAGQINQAYHPPLYYLMAAVPWLLTHNWKVVQLVSLLFSIGTLVVIYFALRRPMFPCFARPWCMALAAFHPQFVVYSLVISNDTLAIFFGALLALCLIRAREEPTGRNQAVLALVEGLGLLSKATFLAFLPVLFAFWTMTNPVGRPLSLRLRTAVALLALTLAVGSFNYVRNLVLFDDPLISNLDFYAPWAALQSPTVVGIGSFVDINIFKLLKEPTISDSTRQSLPLLFYASFWYSYVPDCSFDGNKTAAKWIGSAIYAVALLPTCVVFLGLGALAAGKGQNPTVARYVLSLFLMNLTLVAIAGMKYDVWSIFQSRLLLPSFTGVLLGLANGLERLGSRWRRLATVNLMLLYALFALYFAVEIFLSLKFPKNLPEFP